MSIDLDLTVFEFNEDSIMKESSSKKPIEINNNGDGDLDKSATLDELLAECDDEEEERKEITIQRKGPSHRSIYNLDGRRWY